MPESKLEYLKNALDEQGLGRGHWEDWLDIASETVCAAWKVLEKFEPYAVNQIHDLKESEEYLLTLKEELLEEVV